MQRSILCRQNTHPVVSPMLSQYEDGYSPRQVLIKYWCCYKRTSMPVQVDTRVLVCVACAPRSCWLQGPPDAGSAQPVSRVLYLHYVSGKCQGNVCWQGAAHIAPEARKE